MGRAWTGAACGLALLAAATGVAAQGRSPPAGAAGDRPEFAVDAITVATPERDAYVPNRLCVVWADAEGLGVGPAQLGGLHGLSLTIDPSTPNGTTLEQALTAAKTAYPGAPDWFLGTVRGRAAVIAQACGGAHAEPVVIARLTARDRGAAAAPR